MAILLLLSTVHRKLQLEHSLIQQAIHSQKSETFTTTTNSNVCWLHFQWHQTFKFSPQWKKLKIEFSGLSIQKQTSFFLIFPNSYQVVLWDITLVQVTMDDCQNKQIPKRQEITRPCAATTLNWWWPQKKKRRTWIMIQMLKGEVSPNNNVDWVSRKQF